MSTWVVCTRPADVREGPKWLLLTWIDDTKALVEVTQPTPEGGTTTTTKSLRDLADEGHILRYHREKVVL